jgi:hypothetical protein
VKIKIKTNIIIHFSILIALIVAIAGCASLSQSRSEPQPRELTAIEKDFIANDYELIYRIKELPKPIATLFLQQPPAMANPGEPYNETDVFDPALPFTQLSWAGISKGIVFLFYKQGGFIPHQKIVIFKLKQDQIIQSAAFITRFDISDIVSLKKFLLSGKAIPIK